MPRNRQPAVNYLRQQWSLMPWQSQHNSSTGSMLYRCIVSGSSIDINVHSTRHYAAK